MAKEQFLTWGPCVLLFTLEDAIIKRLLEKGNKSREENLDFRKNLAGNIEEEFYYKDYDWFIPDFTPYINRYRETIQSKYGMQCESWYLESLWINYMKAGEYNPPHSHIGHLSFVIYVDVPSEIALEKNEHRHQGPGVISFDWGQQMPISISRISHIPKTGDAIIFPGWLTHHVHGFKSPVERVSVSGNIYLKSSGLPQKEFL